MTTKKLSIEGLESAFVSLVRLDANITLCECVMVWLFGIHMRAARLGVSVSSLRAADEGRNHIFSM